MRERNADGEAVPEVGLAPEVAGVVEAVSVRVERVQQPKLKSSGICDLGDLEQRRWRGDLGVDHQAVPEVGLVPDVHGVVAEAVGVHVRIERVIRRQTDSRMPFL